MKKETIKALKSELIRAFSLLCDGCYKRDEVCDGGSEKHALKWLQERGWRIIEEKSYCAKCAKERLTNHR